MVGERRNREVRKCEKVNLVKLDEILQWWRRECGNVNFAPMSVMGSQSVLLSSVTMNRSVSNAKLVLVFLCETKQLYSGFTVGGV